MANYAVTDYVTKQGPLSVVMAELETYLETVVDSKTIYLLTVQNVGGVAFEGAVIHAA